ncbi:MAG: hypothetical protein LBT59_16580 [Clostridiales bacterium]|jgi:hypothetical protein|nr:hypothetical protein [Clostridiales bacterium]
MTDALKDYLQTRTDKISYVLDVECDSDDNFTILLYDTSFDVVADIWKEPHYLVRTDTVLKFFGDYYIDDLKKRVMGE